MPRMGNSGYHHVRSGDTLYSIAFDYGLDYREIARWNRITSPYRIYPGQQLSLTPTDGRGLKPLAYYSKPIKDKSISAPKPQAKTTPAKPETAPAKAETSPPKETSSSSASPAAKTASRKETRSPEDRKAAAATKWQWPAEGKVVTRFALKQGKKGIDIQGQTGQRILATAGGKVVYSGKGLIGYGNMVIIKHSDSYLSAYGHNRRLLVKEGERVEAGQKIAEMGQRSKSGSILHFEIRRNGSPVDPIGYLPAKN